MQSRPVLVTNAVEFEMHDNFAKQDEPAYQTRRIYVSVPDSEVPDAGFPVIFLLDANACFRPVAEQIRLASRHPKGIQPAILVGIGYDITEPYDTKRRWYDFTPATALPAKQPLAHMRRNGPVNYGGAAALGEFIEKQLKPWLAAHYDVDKDNYTLNGHSLGGLFTLNTLLNNPGYYQHFIAVSPSLWWHDNHLLNQLKQTWHDSPALLERQLNQKHLSVYVGGEEREVMLPDAKQFMRYIETFVETKGVIELNHLNHGLVVQPAIAHGLLQALPKQTE
ncbi:alpha/beta hydrolase [Methylophaga frappieri]|uniref:alpha/beta hydrolase n=1 Tax=Methylophaga frappieri (strain ATCC BAA-2434 / DSM 25690 / JAM7) TaxID=754477 RepID=UPI0002F45901|nr:alpha/beta hydrolase-fold protein [Methylophaga frappieri]